MHRLHARSQWPRGAAEWLDGLEQSPTDPEILRRFASLQSVGLGVDDASFDTELRAHIHDLTVDSVGLLTNVRHGGLKKDLNLRLGDRVRVTTANGNTFTYRIAGVFYTGQQQVDRSTVYMALRPANSATIPRASRRARSSRSARIPATCPARPTPRT